MLDDILEIPNFLPQKYAEDIENMLLGEDFPWFFNKHASYDNKEIVEKFEKNDPRLRDTSAFIHGFMLDSNVNSDYFLQVKPILYFLEQKCKIITENIFRIRGVFVPPNPSMKNYMNIPHVDINLPHTTVLYYVNDCDGDTVIFNELFGSDNWFAPKTVAYKCKPQKNKALIFNGLRYHTGCVPTINNRVLINFNIGVADAKV